MIFLPATLAAIAAAPRAALANVPVPFDPAMNPPMDDRQKFIDWMVKNRGEDPNFLGERFDRFRHMVANKADKGFAMLSHGPPSAREDRLGPSEQPRISIAR